MKCLLFVLASFLFLPPHVAAQPVTGFWKGSLTMQGGCFKENNIELQVTVAGNIVTGNSYHYLNISNYIKKEFRGTYESGTKKLVLQEGAITEYRIPNHCIICIKKYELTYTKKGNVETLEGGWTGYVPGAAQCQPGTITLSRIATSAFIETDVPEIGVDTGQIRLDFYDNGTVDGDSISVLVNGQMIVSHQKLSVKPITAFVKIDVTSQVQEVVMVAENLGSIPPNTALLIITAGDKRYRLFLTSTETKSAKARLVYDKDVGAKERKNQRSVF